MRSDVKNPEGGSADVPLLADGIRLCPTCTTPLAADNRGDFCPVCMLRNALGGIVETDVEGSAAATPSIVQGQFEHYELLRDEEGCPIELGRGAMGVTYKGFDVDLQCLVALKVIREKYLGDEPARLRFLREARAAASLRHPNVASVFHLGKSSGNYFYAMEFVEGDTLEQLIRRSCRLEVKLAMEIVTQVAAGLSAVYKQKLVHRDIKPSNIMVRFEEGTTATVKIIDLGLAKSASESSSEAAISLTGAFAGTPEFASPEQFSGMRVDIRSDLYSLGVTLWKMLTGETPFRGSLAEIMNQHQQAPLPLDRLQGLPQPTRALLEVLLKKDPARRFQTPAELLQMMPMVRGAIAAGRSLLKTIRIFVSSTGDVQKERNLAERTIRSLAAELNVPLRDSCRKFQRLAEEEGAPKTETDHDSSVVLCTYFWEYQKYRPDSDCEAQIPKTADFDLANCILLSRLGTLASSTLTLPDSSLARSGTEYEFAWALEHPANVGGLRSLQVYRNRSKPTPPLEPMEERQAFGREWDAVQDFFAHWEQRSEAKLAPALNNYRNLEEFDELFREHLRDFLTSRLQEEIGKKSLHRKIPRWKTCPFRGLNVFGFEHAPIFHGRTKAIGEVLEVLEDQAKAGRPFVLILGASGSGKSSLLQAGVLPLLTRPESIEGIRLWRWALTRPGAGGSAGDCFDALAGALLESSALPSLQNSESMNPIRDLATELRQYSDSVALRVRDALDHTAREWKIHHSHSLEEKERQLRSAGISEEADLACQRREKLEIPKVRLALVVDQLEELFTSGFSPEVRQKYVAALAGLVRSGRVFLLAALRSDFYSSYQEFPDLIELAKPGGKFDLRPPTPHEIRNMIRLPAESACLSFEQDRETGQRLDQALRDAASATPESLPLLEHVLSLLYDAQNARGDGLLRWSDYRELGELKGALARHAETVFGTLPPDEQNAFPLVMRHLVTLGQGEEEVPNRRTVPYRDFLASSKSDLVQKTGEKGLIDLFIEKRLFVADTDPLGQVTVSVAHEALLREWQRVKEWLAENREFLRMRDRLDFSLKLWLSRGKQKDDLLGPGLPLAEGEKLRKDFGSSLSHLQLQYVDFSIAERRRRQRTRERIRYAVMAGITSALIIATIFGVVSYRQYRRAERSKLALDQAVKRATLARDEAQKFINFMTVDLRDKLRPVGRLDLLDDVNKRVMSYYDHLVDDDKSPQVQWQRTLAMFNYGNIQQARADLPGALKTLKETAKIQKELLPQSPKNVEWQRNFAATLELLGDVLKLQGNVVGALESYGNSLPIRERLAAGDPGGSALQLDWSVILERIGDVFNAEGNVGAALENYQKSLPIRQRLVAKDPNNPTFQDALSQSYIDIADTFGAQGLWDDALKWYRNALAIKEKLAAQNAGNANIESDLASALIQTGYALVLKAQLNEALVMYRRSLVINQALAAKDPTATGRKRNLSISLERVGDVLKAQGKYSEALQFYRDSLAVREELASEDKSNLVWQSDVSYSNQEIGDALMSQNKFDEAIDAYQKSLTIAKQNAIADPTNEEWQSDLQAIRERTGEAFEALGRPVEALRELRDALDIAESLAKADPKNADRATAEALALFEVSMNLPRTDKLSSAEARTMLTTARDILLQLKLRSALNATDQRHLDQIEDALSTL
jgi:serine/threonine protein kinase/tetratricopeptide (TPR) repeat protein